MKIIINTENKKFLMRDSDTLDILYNFDKGNFKSDIFLNIWLDLLNKIQRSELAESDKKIHIWHVAAPKSGSTWLTKILQNLFNGKICPLVSTTNRREQEIDELNLIYPALNNSVFSPNQHCRYSDTTKNIIEKMDIKVILQYRNIFDSVISNYDHFEKDSLVVPMAYMDEINWNALDKDTRMDFIVDLVVPWYFNFYAGWFSSDLVKEGKVHLVSYEDLVSDPCHEVKRITEWLNIEKTDAEINSSIRYAADKNTRKNQGITGRGTNLSPEQKQRIYNFVKYYPNIDFKILGL